MVFVKKSTFFWYVSFLAKSHKETFFDILDRKKSSLDLKSEVLTKSKKNRSFAKGLVHGFCQKIDLFSYVFFFKKKGQKEAFFYILDRKECHLDLKGEVLSKSKNIVILEGVSPWFLSKNLPYSYKIFFLAKREERKFFWYSG